MKNLVLLTLILFSVITSCQEQTKPVTQVWPEITKEMKPWTRWWWMGNSVTKDGITQHLEAFKEADLGGVPWKNYYDINFVDIRYQAFDASI